MGVEGLNANAADAANADDDVRQTYDVRALMADVVDPGSFFEIGTAQFGNTQVTGLARVGGETVGGARGGQRENAHIGTPAVAGTRSSSHCGW